MMRLIVADDAPFIREIIRNITAGEGIEIIGEAVDGVEAVELALRFRPDVVLMDIIMPRKSGIEAATDILAQLPRTKIIAVSTVDQEVMVLRALEAGCCTYLAKPFTKEELLKIIKQSFLSIIDK